MKLQFALLPFALAGALMAQNAVSPPATQNQPVQTVPNQSAQTSPHRALNRRNRMVRRLTRRLKLTPDQQTKVKAIFADARTQTKTLAPQLREERMNLKAAVKSDSPSKIDQITQQNAQLNSQVEAIHVKAIAKVYAILTPAQRTSFDHMGRARLTSGSHHSGVKGWSNS